MSCTFSSATWTSEAGPGDGSTAFGKVTLPISKSALDFRNFTCFALGFRTRLKALDLF